ALADVPAGDEPRHPADRCVAVGASEARSTAERRVKRAAPSRFRVRGVTRRGGCSGQASMARSPAATCRAIFTESPAVFFEGDNFMWTRGADGGFYPPTPAGLRDITDDSAVARGRTSLAARARAQGRRLARDPAAQQAAAVADERRELLQAA